MKDSYDKGCNDNYFMGNLERQFKKLRRGCQQTEFMTFHLKIIKFYVYNHFISISFPV